MWLQADVDAAVKSLLSLKADYKSATGKDWKPGQAPPAAEPAPAAAPASASGASALDLHNKIVEQGNAVRDLKGKKDSKVRQLQNVILIIIILSMSDHSTQFF